MSTNDDSPVTLAVHYNDRGVPSFPVALRWDPDEQHIVKRPLLGTGGFRNAGRNAGQVRKLFREVRRIDAPIGEGRELGTDEVIGVGIWPGPAGMFMLDVDIKNGQRGDEELAVLEIEHSTLPETVRAVTASGGGHIWLRKPDDRTVDNTALAPGVDVRGDNGYIVAPGTTSPWGNWEFDGPSFLDGAIVEESPQWVTTTLHERATDAGTCDAEPAAEIDLGALPAKLTALLEEDPVVGKRSDRIYHFVCVGIETALDDGTILAALAHYPPAIDKGDVVRQGQLAIGHARANGVAPGAARTENVGETATQPVGITDKQRSGPGPLILDPPSQPMPVAREFLAEHYEHSDGYTLVRAWRGGWWSWQRAKWAEIEERAVSERAYRFTEDAYWWKTKPDGEKTLEPWAPNRYKIADLLDAAKAITYLRRDVDQPEWIETVDGMPHARELVSVANGLLHIHTRALYDHDPRLFNLTAVPFGYDPDAPAPTRWLTFLDELWSDDPDSIAALQEFFGYVISGRTDMHKILLLVGPLRGGKGTIARILKDLIGKGNYAGPTLASLATNFGMAPLIGKSLAIVSDARLSARSETNQVVERLLSISGEDMLTVDIKYKEQWTGTLPTRFMIISNELPRFGDASGAIATRFVTLVLTQSWLGKENTKLTNELREELPGILSWALDGLDRLNAEEKFTDPESSVDAMVALRDLVSPVSAFVRERCTIGPHEILVKDLYAAWKDWAEDNGHKPGSSQTFGRDLRAAQAHIRVRRPRDDEGHRDRYYVGITLSGRLPIGENDG
jgi:putative DNA primase/helicase